MHKCSRIYFRLNIQRYCNKSTWRNCNFFSIKFHLDIKIKQKCAFNFILQKTLTSGQHMLRHSYHTKVYNLGASILCYVYFLVKSSVLPSLFWYTFCECLFSNVEKHININVENFDEQKSILWNFAIFKAAIRSLNVKKKKQQWVCNGELVKHAWFYVET